MFLDFMVHNRYVVLPQKKTLFKKITKSTYYDKYAENISTIGINGIHFKNLYSVRRSHYILLNILIRYCLLIIFQTIYHLNL